MGASITSGASEPTNLSYFFMIPYTPGIIDQGTFSFNALGSAYMGWGYLDVSSHANNDGFHYMVNLEAGTYTLKIIATVAVTAPILQVRIDGVEVAAFDTYNAGGTVGNTVFTQAGITVTGSGRKNLSFRSNGKNGASSDYYFRIQVIELIRTA